MQILFFRHSMTAGNFERRYLGCKTDEPLCPEGIAFATQQAKQISFPLPEQVFVSPMRRCRETASILFPNLKQQIHPDLRECVKGRIIGNFPTVPNIKHGLTVAEHCHFRTENPENNF